MKNIVSHIYESLLLRLYSIPYFNKKSHNRYWGKLYSFLLKNKFSSIETAWKSVFSYEFQNPSTISFINNGKKVEMPFNDYLEVKNKHIINQFESIINENQVDAIFDLGSGWSRNSITLSRKFKHIKIFSGEFSEGGRKVANHLINEFGLDNLQTFKFDWNNPHSLFDIVLTQNLKTIILFSNCSIEQIPKLKKTFFNSLIKLKELNFFAIHNEPVGWQLIGSSKPFKENYNSNFIQIVKKLSEEDKIANLHFEKNTFGHKNTKVGKNVITITYKNI